jgi:hypothetical protein
MNSDSYTYCNLSNITSIFEKLDENIKEFYYNFFKVYNDTCDINSINIYIGNWKLLSVNEVNIIYEKNIYNKQNIDFAVNNSEKIIVAFYNTQYNKILFRYKDTDYEKYINIDRKLKNKGITFNNFITNIASGLSSNIHLNIINPIY